MREIIDLRQLAPMPPGEAAALLAARMRDPQTGQDADVLEQWLAQDEAHRAAWESAQDALALFDAAGEDEILAALRAEAMDAGPEHRGNWTRGLAAAAAIATFFVGGLAYYEMRQAPQGGQVAQALPQAASAQRYATAKGEIRSFDLPDGSRMTLDAVTTVDVAFAPAERDLRLRGGRAHFEVAHDKARPFTVHAAGRAVLAVGTRFDVRMDGRRVTVLLAEGRVKVSGLSGDGSALFLTPGQQLVDEPGKAPVVTNVDPASAEGWREGMISFQDATLASVALELNRYTDDKLVIRDPDVAALRVSGAFRTGDVARFARTIAAIYPVRVVQNGPNEWEIAAGEEK